MEVITKQMKRNVDAITPDDDTSEQKIDWVYYFAAIYNCYKIVKINELISFVKM